MKSVQMKSCTTPYASAFSGIYETVELVAQDEPYTRSQARSAIWKAVFRMARNAGHERPAAREIAKRAYEAEINGQMNKDPHQPAWEVTEDFVDDCFHAAIAAIQHKIKQTDGGVAAVHFSDDERDWSMRLEIRSYLKTERCYVESYYTDGFA